MTKTSRSPRAPSDAVPAKGRRQRGTGSRAADRRHASAPDNPAAQTGAWRFDAAAMAVEHDPAAGRPLSVLHPTRPFERTWDADEASLFSIAGEYLTSVWRVLDLPEAWRADLLGRPVSDRKRPLERLRWLPLGAGSFWSESRPAGRAPEDRALCLVASLAVPMPGGGETLLHGGEGMMLTVHVRSPAGAAPVVRILGAMHTLPARREVLAKLRAAPFDANTLGALPERTLAAFGLGGKHEVDGYGLRFVDADRAELEVRLRTARLDGDGPSMQLVARAPLDRPLDLRPVSRRALVSFATIPVFEQDPLSHEGPAALRRVRPNRPSSAFDAYRVPMTLPAMQRAGGSTGPEVLADGAGLIRVTGSEYAEPRNGAPANVPSTSPLPSRGDASSAVNAWARADALFSRMNRYGLDPQSTLRFIQFPLVVRYRAGMMLGPGRNGKTVNAQVQWAAPAGRRPQAPTPPGKRVLEMRFALGDMSRFHSREPITTALDPRWGWHELCHVLLAGATGALEFRFAHSAGDALAAILNDPGSALARDERLRGVTFPWIPIPGRRHDRDASRGWSFAGTMYMRDRVIVHHGECDKRSYWAEQLVSSSLFRLYRSLGGDTCSGAAPDVSARRRAAEYAAWLVIRGILLAGDDEHCPTSTPDQFVQRLVCATRIEQWVDVGVGAPWPRVVARKVIEWAFEQQGLGHPASPVPVNAPARPAGADVYVPDVARTRGDYAPVDLASAGWHADENGLAIMPTTGTSVAAGKKAEVVVRVGNRGLANAANVKVVLYEAALTAAGVLPAWGSGAWSKVGEVTPGAVAPDVETQAAPIAWTPSQSGSYALLASVTCDTDASNVDDADLPAGVAIADLVPFDNNLALRLVDVV